MKKNDVFTKFLILFVAVFLFSLSTTAQVGIGTTTPADGSILDLTSADKGFLVPRVDIVDLATIDPVTGGATDGLLVWNTNGTTGVGYHYWNGARWIPVGSAANWALTGNANATAANFLGTTNNIPLNIRTNNNERMRFLADGTIGIRTATPANFLQMTNGGVAVGANAMASFDNLGASGVSLSGFNQSTTSGYNALEGVTNYNRTTNITAGVFGVALSGILTHNGIGVRGSANGRDGTGVRGSIQRSTGLGWAGEFYGDVGTTGDYYYISDLRTKKDIVKIQNALNIVKQLNPVTYYYDLDKYSSMGLNEKMEYGFIAQEVRDVLPEVTKIKGLDTNGAAEVKPNQLTESKTESFVVLDYSRIIPVLTKGIQEQQNIIETQNDKISSLEDKMAILESRLNALIENQN